MTRDEKIATLFNAETEARNGLAAMQRACGLLDELVNDARLDDATFARKLATLRKQLAMAGGDTARALAGVDGVTG